MIRFLNKIGYRLGFFTNHRYYGPSRSFKARAWCYRLCHKFVMWFSTFMYPKYRITPGYIVEKTLRGRIAKYVFHSCPTTRLYKPGEYERLYGKV